jgi:hypothetical protein
MTRSIVKLPADAEEHFEVYVNGVLQQPDIDYYLDSRKLIFERALRQHRVSGWRWFLGAWGDRHLPPRRHHRHPIRSRRRNAPQTRNADPLADEPGDDS